MTGMVDQLTALVLAIVDSHRPRRRGLWVKCSCGAQMREERWQAHINGYVHPVVKAWLAGRGESLEPRRLPVVACTPNEAEEKAAQ